MSTVSSSAASSSTLSHSEEPRFEAGPLPRKRGEIGFQEEIHGQLASASIQPPPPAILPARHPADTDVPPVVSQPVEASTSTSPATTTATSDAASTSSIVKRKGILHFLKPKKVPSFGGIRLTTLLAFVLQLCIIAGTIAGWAISVRVVMHGASIMQSDTDNNSPSAPSSIFIHIVFGIAVLGQTLFLERRLFRLRAERYAFIHPGEMLPTARRPHSDPSIAFSPWNRPPLPTYAAALAQSGVGTGDVEDHIIAAPPPPAYGNTRGSTLLLAGFLRNSLRAQRPVSTQSHMSQQHVGRPVSYGVDDEEWEIIQDAERAIHLEEALTRLEGAPR